ncbi:MAG: UDP-N-acetylmuramoylalanine--D-glutamate ligase, partial [Kiritimatiellae bacterium]|nr:UDP-N-acetylmuramoylalanine--D-glutamate ligase [Kiritimatiellia bacterium]
GLKDSEIREAFLKFEPLAHRMNEIGVFRGIKCIDDSKATSLAAMAAAIEMVKGPLRLIAGGRAKGDNPKIVKELLTKRVKKVYLIGECSNAFFEAWSNDVDCEICGTLDNAVKSAFKAAVNGETLLLSPGTASYDQFKNYSERGEKFAFWVKKEGK